MIVAGEARGAPVAVVSKDELRMVGSVEDELCIDL